MHVCACIHVHPQERESAEPVDEAARVRKCEREKERKGSE